MTPTPQAPPSQSIHPRVENGRTAHTKRNTCAPRSNRNGGQGGKVLRKTTANLNARIKHWLATAGSSIKAQNSQRKPGSMKP